MKLKTPKEFFFPRADTLRFKISILYVAVISLVLAFFLTILSYLSVKEPNPSQSIFYVSVLFFLAITGLIVRMIVIRILSSVLEISNTARNISGDNVFNNRVAGVLKGNDKRRSRRLPVNVLASCERLNRRASVVERHFISYTGDLSMEGGKFIVSEDIETGQHFTAALELPVHFLPVLIDCEVKWVRRPQEQAGKGNTEAGVRFVKIDLSCDEEKLKSYLSYV